MQFNSLTRRAKMCVAAMAILSQAAWGQTATCDLNGDGNVNVVDVQLVTNQEIGVVSCTANIGGVLGCTDSARQVVIKAALGGGCHFISLSWGASSSAGVVGYNIYRGTTAGGESTTPINTSPVTGTTFTDINTVSGITYFYVIKATNGSAESAPSSEASATAL